MDRQKKIPIVVILTILVGAAFIFDGCDKLPLPGKDKPKRSSKIIITRKPPPKPTVAPATPSPATAEPKKQEPRYVYNPIDKRDPFRPFLAMREPVLPPEEGVQRGPLQKYDLSQLKLVAILVGGGEGRAVLEDSEGKGYIVTTGTYVGSRYGKVTAIQKDQVTIQEQYKDYLGVVRSREIVLQLRVPGEEKRP